MDDARVDVSEIKAWIEEGEAAGATHVIIMRDTFDGSCFSINVMPNDNVQAMATDDEEAMEKVVEVYNLALNINKQLAEDRAMNL